MPATARRPKATTSVNNDASCSLATGGDPCNRVTITSFSDGTFQNAIRFGARSDTCEIALGMPAQSFRFIEVTSDATPLNITAAKPVSSGTCLSAFVHPIHLETHGRDSCASSGGCRARSVSSLLLCTNILAGPNCASTSSRRTATTSYRARCSASTSPRSNRRPRCCATSLREKGWWPYNET